MLEPRNATGLPLGSPPALQFSPFFLCESNNESSSHGERLNSRLHNINSQPHSPQAP